jgi:hypothetical protein
MNRSIISSEQPSSFRRGGGARQPSEGWRRTRGDDDENNEQNEDSSTPPNGSSSWASRGGQARRGGGSGLMDQRTKSSDKWTANDDRPGRYKNIELKFSFSNFIFFSKNKKVNQISNVDGDRMHLCLIVTLINVVHKQNVIVGNFILNQFEEELFFFRFRNARMDG